MLYFWDAANSRTLTNPHRLDARSACKNGYASMPCVDTFGTGPITKFKEADAFSWSYESMDKIPVDFLLDLINMKVTNLADILIFYAGQLYENIDADDRLPDGGYVYMNKKWYVKEYSKLVIIAAYDVPKDIRLHAAIITGEF